ncbi:MAG: hypothetical protein PW734_05260 [Verrucomicrobium sp.]|nr:hypothetical protein [Verrucomicrobium sp.]
MIGVAFALEHEAAGVHARMKRVEKFRLGEVPCRTGTLGGVPILTAILGMGAETAVRRAGILLDEMSLRLLILPGYGGALSPELRRPSVHIATNYLSPQVSDWASKLPQATPAKLYSSAEVVCTPQERQALVDQGYQVVDMETAVVAGVCAAHNVPLLPFRVISDEAAEVLPSGALAASFDLETQKPRVLRLLAYLARHPGEAKPFFQLVGHLGVARKALTEAVEQVLA